MLIIPSGAWEVERALSHHMIQAGENVTIKLRLNRKWPWPLFICVVEELFPKSLQISGSGDSPRRMKKILFPGFSRELQIQYVLESIPRGIHQFAGLRMMTTDCFGLIKKEHTFPCIQKLISYPNDRSLTDFNKGSMMNEGNQSGPISMQATNVASGARPYVSGDRISSIDWKKTAQQQQLMTKEFEQETGREILLVLDVCAYEHGDAKAFETSIELALGFIRSQANLLGGTFLSIGKTTTTFRLADAGTEAELMHHLAGLKQEVHMPFSMKLREELLRSKGGKEIIIITPNLTEGLEETILQSQVAGGATTVITVGPAAIHRNGAIAQIIAKLRMRQVRVLSYTEQETAGGVQ